MPDPFPLTSPARDASWLGDLATDLVQSAERRVRKDPVFAEAVASLEALLEDGLTFQELRLALALALPRRIGL